MKSALCFWLVIGLFGWLSLSALAAPGKSDRSGLRRRATYRMSDTAREVAERLAAAMPYRVRVLNEPEDACVPLDIRLLLMDYRNGEEPEMLWQVMDGETVQFETGHFGDLYLVCEAPSCCSIRIVRWCMESGEKVDAGSCLVSIE